ncbi:MAG: beta-galactosidase [Oscillospiraceae bacterium]|nr:beta-galactosidase [Oscillospiraceae bacterium]
MEKFDYNERGLTRNGKPWFPVMGEIHYSRVPETEWEVRLRKMKAGGVDIASSYVIWIHHEEAEGEYDFSGQKGLRRFIECCRDCGLYFFLRIGPWSHAEVRHGGLPDWLFEKGFEPRTNDPEYFLQVERFYRAIFEQVKGLFASDGGPIIGVQIENEYGHCGGLSGDEGIFHMRTLTRLARDIGFDAPYFTATGWGGAITAGLLPVMGGYCESPWDPRITEIEPSGNYIFTHERNDHNIGSDYGINESLSFDPAEFPYLTAELGGGLQVTHRRRPVATGADIGAMSLVKLGSGASLLGYYMYSGGTNPKGRFSSLHESREAGDINDMPEFSYDFRAPIREYGQLGDPYREIKLLALFLRDFGGELSRMDTFIPEANPLHPENTDDLRISVRRSGNSGYVFVNNYQRRQKQAEHLAEVLTVPLENGSVTFPPIDIRDGDFFFLPFNMPIGSAVLKTALATPLCVLNDHTYFFYTDGDPCYDMEGPAGRAEIITLTREQALNAYKVRVTEDHLIITDGALIEDEDGITIESGRDLRVLVYPEFRKVPEGLTIMGKSGVFRVYERKYPEVQPRVSFENISSDDSRALYSVRAECAQSAADCLLHIAYQGDSAKLYIDGNPEGDDFNTGEPWEIGLKRFGISKELTIEIFPIRAEDEIFLEKRPTFTNGVACRLDAVRAEARYETRVRLT